MVKAAFTDFGFETAVAAQQVFGGHGYIREWGMEQYVRDARIAQIYEGTNGVQAMDLVTRKLGLDGGALVRRFFALVRDDLGAAEPAAGAALVAPVAEALARLEAATERLAGAAPLEAGAAATDYLRLFALVAFGWMWVRMAAAATAIGEAATPVEQRKPALARFFVERMLPQTLALAAALGASADVDDGAGGGRALTRGPGRAGARRGSRSGRGRPVYSTIVPSVAATIAFFSRPVGGPPLDGGGDHPAVRVRPRPLPTGQPVARRRRRQELGGARTDFMGDVDGSQARVRTHIAASQMRTAASLMAAR